MGKVIATTQATVDGVIDSVGEWVEPEGDHGDHSFELQKRSAGLLLGRKTYEGLAGFWPQQPESDKWAAMVNPLPKYVASRTLQGELDWNATVIEGDLAEEVGKLKEQPGQNILKYGTGELTRSLMDHDLIDEFHYWIFPVVLGAGRHLLEGSDTTSLKLVDTTTFGSGIVVHKYAPK
jgi:dihydrofolate reductase